MSRSLQHDRPQDIEPGSTGMLRLFELCEPHLDREEQHLEKACAALKEIYAAAVSGRPQRLAEVLKQHEATSRAANDIRQERDRFRREAGALLDIPADSVALRTIAGRMPAPFAQHVLERRRHLQQLAAQMDRQARDIALLSHYFLDFLQRFFIALTGGRDSGRYGPEGLRREHVCGCLVQTQG